jgi:hypothetical protein
MVYFLQDWIFNLKPSEKDHDLPGIRTRDLWSSSQHTQPLHHLDRLYHFVEVEKLKFHVTTIYFKNLYKLKID